MCQRSRLRRVNMNALISFCMVNFLIKSANNSSTLTASGVNSFCWIFFLWSKPFICSAQAMLGSLNLCCKAFLCHKISSYIYIYKILKKGQTGSNKATRHHFLIADLHLSLLFVIQICYIVIQFQGLSPLQHQ